ncbi:hypothetical protein ES705_31513 [subsurface metagenome]|nr:MFS transporter [Methanosarcinales archaeon]
MSSRISIDHHKEVAIYAVLTFVAMLSLTIMAPVIKEFIIDRFDASNTEASMFFTLEMLAYVIFAVVWGSHSDKCGKRKPFIVFSTVFRLFPILYRYPYLGDPDKRCSH